MGSPTRRNPLFAARLETRPIVVWRPPQPHVAADDFRRSPIRFRRGRPTRRLLEAGLTTEPVDSTAGISTYSEPFYNRGRRRFSATSDATLPGLRLRPAPTRHLCPLLIASECI